MDSRSTVFTDGEAPKKAHSESDGSPAGAPGILSVDRGSQAVSEGRYTALPKKKGKKSQERSQRSSA